MRITAAAAMVHPEHERAGGVVMQSHAFDTFKPLSVTATDVGALYSLL